MSDQRRRLKLEELKDARGDHFLRISSPYNGNILYSSPEGYKNKSELIESSVQSAIRILEEYSPHLLNIKL